MILSKGCNRCIVFNWYRNSIANTDMIKKKMFTFSYKMLRAKIGDQKYSYRWTKISQQNHSKHETYKIWYTSTTLKNYVKCFSSGIVLADSCSVVTWRDQTSLSALRLWQIKLSGSTKRPTSFRQFFCISQTISQLNAVHIQQHNKYFPYPLVLTVG